MDMKEVPASSNIHSHGYDPDSMTMAIKFKNGGLYHGVGITQQAYDAFAAAQSMGSHFHKNLRSQFQFVKQP